MRRDIHWHPELADEERRTSALVAERLRAAGLAVVTGVGGHGVVAVLDGAGEGPTVAYRADMDAVDDDELFDCTFASQVPRASHLCGHDLRTAIGVGIALVLARLRKQLNGRVVFVFQSAEETCEGARAMIEENSRSAAVAASWHPAPDSAAHAAEGTAPSRLPQRRSPRGTSKADSPVPAANASPAVTPRQAADWMGAFFHGGRGADPAPDDTTGGAGDNVRNNTQE
ncbi:M20/M25/M40 family metallo-hydrolase [Streptomyces sp. NPDC058424]|uniref:M20/M25/M40 family metallo-hydrolase n=1 Tax=Streptomyces sp. NPDC058424 TaxID=3346491 RepID=UPI00365A51B8